MADPGAVGERPLPVVLERPCGGLADRVGGEDVGARGAAGEADHVGGHRRDHSNVGSVDRGAGADPTGWAAGVTDHGSLLSLAEELATRAAELSLERLGEPRSDVRTKSSATDMVSEVDEACERLIVEGIRGARPDDGILSEEGASADGHHRRALGDRPDRRHHQLPLRPSRLRDLDRRRGRRGDRRRRRRTTRSTASASPRPAAAGRPATARRSEVSGETELGSALIATGFAYTAARARRPGRAARRG